MRILIAEDDREIVNFLIRGLEAEGHIVDVASTQWAAFDLIKGHAYDAMIIDIFLGDHNGIEICRELRGRQVSTPILLMTAKDSTEMRAECYQAGANAYLPKPFAFNDLLGFVKSLGHVTLSAAPLITYTATAHVL